MSRINTNIASMNAITKLIANNADLGTRLKRLSSGLRINSGKDDPAGLIASESLRSEMRGLEKGITNSTRADSVIATAEGALNEISALLIDIRGLLVETANKGALSTEEIDANQLQVDSAINSIERISNATEFEGMKLLNGNLNYVTDYSAALAANQVDDFQVNSAKLIDGAAMTVSVNQTTQAERGTHILMDSSVAATTSQVTIELGSARGTTELTFASGTTQAQVISAINKLTEVTGVTAAINATTSDVEVLSVDYGSEQYATVDITSTATGGLSAEGTDYGVDAVAVVNGTSAIGKGLDLTVRTSMIDAKITMDSSFTTGATNNLSVTSGGADFAIGSRVDAIGMAAIGIMSVAPSQLGTSSDNLNTLKSGMDNALSSTNLYTAQRVVDAAIKDISTLRGRLGAFQKNVLETNINSLRVTLENVTASESAIRDADFATETAALTRSQILVQANTSVLKTANSMPQSVLALLQ